MANRTPTLIAATSANFSGTDGPGPSISIDEVREFVAASGADVSVAIDDGVCPTADHLTIISCTTAHAQLAREGIVHTRAVATVLRRELTP
ncbi:hypothetical protein GCM10022251_81260 [Phytohabitans flavus]|uniref:YrdC-like domain-containing protein n=1 Tax=Phytohabitans flavus TaxID=1076124 RepID=A0A6F8XL43_9ACTN|nr:hypothetical protein [Phytohabitans flavus]BCB74536.1 hypothetical protein Pflav_009460 [Phytohabitans flavus]